MVPTWLQNYHRYLIQLIGQTCEKSKLSTPIVEENKFQFSLPCCSDRGFCPQEILFELAVAFAFQHPARHRKSEDMPSVFYLLLVSRLELTILTFSVAQTNQSHWPHSMSLRCNINELWRIQVPNRENLFVLLFRSFKMCLWSRNSSPNIEHGIRSFQSLSRW